MKDRNNVDLEIGQRVAFTWAHDPYVHTGIIVRFTKMKVEVEYKYTKNAIPYKSLKFPEALLVL